ncbi:transporter substrate-binding domain-containing protein [Maritimibacter sp. DP07]|uniref:Transporter substrate-binding domain-containing protein n=1 Tax=Maritimibacter harenae TaxID=2606218 RepID=A0A845M273_9RHOB|nr:transporter substrate-binding domain-containing protein [Maritimibacter harenae]MZR14135.1 transporter substrate-binding domain-containing protein [Maritimibacter harenae]
MKKIVLSAAALAMTAGMAMAESHSMTVRMGTEGAYPPFNYLNDDGEVDGFERELGDAICETAELTCEWVTNEWDSIIPNLVSGNYDTIIAGMSITDERDEVIDFTQAYFPPDPSAFAAMSDSFDGTGVIAAQTGTIQASHVASMDGAQLVEYATPDETIAALRSGEADAVLADKSFLEPIVAEDADLVFSGGDVMLGGGIGMGVRESDTELKEKLDAAIAKLKEDGTVNTLIEKWFDGMEAPY